MLDEYAIIPDVFDKAAYSNEAFIEMCLPHLKEPLFHEALVRDLCDGGWGSLCMKHSGQLHRLCKEIIRKLYHNNRLHRIPQMNETAPVSAIDWCREALSTASKNSLTGIIASQNTKNEFEQGEIASIEKLTSTPWWQNRSPSVTVDRKTVEYLRVLHRVLMQANSIMFIDPNLDPSSHSYREFDQLLAPLAHRNPKPTIEIHRSFCKGDGSGRTFPTEGEWKASFAMLGKALQAKGLVA